MAYEYKPQDRYDVPVNIEHCKAAVPIDSRSPRFCQCKRKSWKDGWCKQHHPDTEAERRKQSEARWEAEWQRTPRAQLARANEEIARLKARITELESGRPPAGK